MEIVEVMLTEIRPYQKNPRKNKNAIDAVAASIKEFGFKVPIVLDKNNVIVTGHTRFEASKKLGLQKAPCIIAADLSEDQVRAYRLADNKTAELAEWDFDLLNEELQSIIDIDMTSFGFVSLEEPTEAVEDNYDVELPEEPRAKYGEVFLLGDHRLMCGDSTIQADVERLMGGQLADMVFTDPPWNVDYGAQENHPSWKQRTILNDSMSSTQFLEFLGDAFKSMSTFSKQGASTYVVMSAQEWGSLMTSLDENGYHWSSTIIWNKDRLVLSRKDYHTKYEPIWYGWKDGNRRLFPLKDRKQTDVWDFERPSRSDEHPTMKPIALVKKAIDNSSVKGSVVLDLFGGSGTTMIASEQSNRKCYMMELDPKYVDVIIDRWEKYTNKKAVKIDEIIQHRTSKQIPPRQICRPNQRCDS